MKIAVDLDGVVWNIMHVFVDIYNSLYLEEVKYEDIDDWYFFPQERFEIVYPLTLPRIMEYPALDEFIYIYLFVLNKEHDVSILTAELNSIETLEEKLKSLGIFKGTQYKELIKIDPKDTKLDYEFDVYIDDKPGLARKMHKFPKRYMLLYDQPWNQDFDDTESKNVWRIFRWDEIKSAIKIIKMSKKGRLL